MSDCSLASTVLGLPEQGWLAYCHQQSLPHCYRRTVQMGCTSAWTLEHLC